MRVAARRSGPRPGRADWAPDGLIAYSKVCTHAGCPVGLYEAEHHQLLCPCHQSAFDVLDGAEPVFGPAGRALPQLPLRDRRRRATSSRDGRLLTTPSARRIWNRRVSARPTGAGCVALASPSASSRRAAAAPTLHRATQGIGGRRIAGVWWLMFGLAAGGVRRRRRPSSSYAVLRGRGRRAARPSRRGSQRRRGSSGSAGSSSRSSSSRCSRVVTVARRPRAAHSRRRGALRDRRRRASGGGGRSRYPRRGVAHRQRDPPPGRPAGRASRLDVRQRDPQLLGAAARRQGRHDPGPAQRPALHRRRTPAPTAGECAEFCGLQHAHMAFVVVVADRRPTSTAGWPRREPAPLDARRPRRRPRAQLVVPARRRARGATPIRGTPAHGHGRPRPHRLRRAHARIGAGTVAEHARRTCAQWIADAQAIKPGRPDAADRS